MVNKKLPVIVGLSGGLGNQMFQYAAGRSLAHRIETTVALDLSWFKYRYDRHFALAPFQIKAIQLTPKPLLFGAIGSRIYRRWSPRIMGAPVWREPHFHFSEKFRSLSEPIFLEGFWQSEKYFEDIRPKLLEDFLLKDSLPIACQKILDQIENCDAVCVHIRRGDYVANAISAKQHGVCSLEYYENGIIELCEQLNNPYCFIFSDDMPWVVSNLHSPYPHKFVDVNSVTNAHLDLILMAACKHFLIANSTLSWWGAWLSEYSGKKVIAPDKWFATQDKKTHDLIPNNWYRR